MTLYEETRRKPLNTEDLLKMIEAEKQSRQKAGKSAPRWLLITSIITFSMCVLALSGVVAMQKMETVQLQKEIGDLKSFKSQSNMNDPKLKIASLETKIDDYTKTKETVLSDIEQLKKEMKEIAELRTPKKQERISRR